MLQRTIQEELQWDPAVDPARIRVRIVGGVAVLEGAVRTYAEKCRAEAIVKRMQGITAVRNELEVRLTIGDYRTDETLQRVLQEGLDALARMPEVRPRVAVRDGWVTLLGEVEWTGVVLDEAQNVKNSETRQAQAARALKARWRVALTGYWLWDHHEYYPSRLPGYPVPEFASAAVIKAGGALATNSLTLLISLVGLWFFADQTLGLAMPDVDWGRFWPVILILIGAWIVLGSRRRGAS